MCLILLFSTGRKEDEIDEKWIERERERGRKEREREERGKKTQMLIFLSFFLAQPHSAQSCQTTHAKNMARDLSSKVLTDNRSQVLPPSLRSHFCRKRMQMWFHTGPNVSRPPLQLAGTRVQPFQNKTEVIQVTIRWAGWTRRLGKGLSRKWSTCEWSRKGTAERELRCSGFVKWSS